MIGISSFSAIDSGWALASQCSWNHAWPHQAPQPQEPEASVVKVVLGRSEGGGRKEVPFHDFRKLSHHARSARNPALRRIYGWWGGTAWRRSIILQRKDLPDLTTLHVWLRKPISPDSQTRDLQFFHIAPLEALEWNWYLLQVWRIEAPKSQKMKTS